MGCFKVGETEASNICSPQKMLTLRLLRILSPKPGTVRGLRLAWAQEVWRPYTANLCCWCLVDTSGLGHCSSQQPLQFAWSREGLGVSVLQFSQPRAQGSWAAQSCGSLLGSLCFLAVSAE